MSAFTSADTILRKIPILCLWTGWYGEDCNPGLSVDDWSRLLKDKTIFTTNALEIMKRIKDYGGAASCKQLSVKYGETINFYNAGSIGLAKRVCDAVGFIPDKRENGSTQFWTVLYTGRDAGKEEEGTFIWKLRDELSEALDQADLSGVRTLCCSSFQRKRSRILVAQCQSENLEFLRYCCGRRTAIYPL